ncbi:MAG TPA: mRNA surveillance protein pelota [Candidatus Diapherotrites archaeon]|jgi:protein pelota|nr:mRNA surveillance protein pelota [Candidatus Diapherotrites archaeon]
MNILSLQKDGKLVFIPQTLEDLWVIKSITDIGDVISGSSYRRIRGNEADNDSTRKPVFVSISIEKFDFSKELNSLRFTGKIVESKPEDLAPLGEYHTLEISLSKSYTLKKPQFFSHQLDLLQNNNSAISCSILLIALDDERANLFELTNIGIKELAVIDSGKPGKRYSSDFDFSNFFSEIFSIVSRYDCQIIIAGPGATKSKLSEFIKQKKSSFKILELAIQNTNKSSINELFSKKEVARFFKNSIIYKEQKILDAFLENLGKNNNKVAYGLQEVSIALDLGACENIMISERLWKRELDKVQELIKKADIVKTKVHIVDEEHDVSKALKSFGGIISTLRYPLTF